LIILIGLNFIATLLFLFKIIKWHKEIINSIWK
jgi:hypothetical protein